MTKKLLFYLGICLTLSSCSLNSMEKPFPEQTGNSLETTTTKAGVTSSEKKVLAPTVQSSKHAGCLNKNFKWYFLGPYCFPVGMLTVCLQDNELFLIHENCMANCSVYYGDEFVSLIAMHPENNTIEFATKLKDANMKCMCLTSVSHHISGIREGKYTLRYIFCGAPFKDITINLKEGKSETFDLKEYVMLDTQN